MIDLWRELLHEFQPPFRNPVPVFSLFLLVMLLAPVLLRRLRMPGIIGLIVSGIIIGPHALNLVEKNAAVDLFATIGLLYILFIAGLELDLGTFAKYRSKSLVFGMLTFILPITLGFPACHYLLGYDLRASLLTASMFATHTLMAYPIVSRLGIARDEAVAVTVGGTILTDTAVLLLLAIITGTESGSSSLMWIRFAVTATILAAVIIIVVPRFTKWLFRHMADDKYAHYIFVMLVVFVMAFLSQLAGLEPIIGAFAAGLTLNRFVPHASPLMNRIQFVGYALFIPFFLISVGMLIDLSVFTAGLFTLAVAATLTVVALTGKWLAAEVTGLLYRYHLAQRRLIFGLSSSHAAATLAVILVGYRSHIIDENILNGTIVLILITCTVASFVTESAGKKVAVLRETGAPPTAEGLEQHILVPIANPATMELLIDFAMAIRQPHNRFPITALTITANDTEAQTRLSEARRFLDNAISHAAGADQRIDITTIIDPNVARGIQRVAHDRLITDIVVGQAAPATTVTGLTDIIFGHTYENIVNHNPQMIFFTRITRPLNLHKRLVLFCPPHAGHEPGFGSWLQRVLCFAESFRLPVTAYTSTSISDRIRDSLRQNHLAVAYQHQDWVEVAKLDSLERTIHNDDWVFLVTQRKLKFSYSLHLYDLRDQIVKRFRSNSLAFVYPEISSGETEASFTREA